MKFALYFIRFSSGCENNLSFRIVCFPASIRNGHLRKRDLLNQPFYNRLLFNLTSVASHFPSGHLTYGAWGSVVVTALRCQSEGLGIEPQWCR